MAAAEETEIERQRAQLTAASFDKVMAHFGKDKTAGDLYKRCREASGRPEDKAAELQHPPSCAK